MSRDIDPSRMAMREMLDSVLADAAPELKDAIAGVPVEHAIMVSILRNMLMAAGKLERFQAMREEACKHLAWVMREHGKVLVPHAAQLLKLIEAGPADVRERLREAVRELQARREDESWGRP